MYQYLPYLNAHGVYVTVASLLDDSYVKSLYAKKDKPFFNVLNSYIHRLILLFKARDFDLVWIEKEIFPWMPALVETLLKKFKVPFVADYDDAIFHNYDLNPNRAIRMMLSKKIEHVMRDASVVIAGNDYIAARAVNAGALRVECLPSVVDLKKYAVNEMKQEMGFNIGWIGTPVTQRYLKDISSAFLRLDKKKSARIITIGSRDINLDGVASEERPWAEETEVADIQDFDVGIMPIPDEPWEKGKCGYKLIQYMACEKPVIASPVGINRKIVKHGKTGFLASSPDEWTKAFLILQDNMDLRKTMGMAGRRLVEQEYSLEVTAPKLLSIFKSVYDNKKINL